MKLLENSIKTSKEVVSFIGEDTILEFVFMAENVLTFKTLIPEYVNGGLTEFELLFYNDSSNDFFRHDNFNNFLSKFKICELRMICLETGDTTTLFEQTYLENK